MGGALGLELGLDGVDGEKADVGEGPGDAAAAGADESALEEGDGLEEGPRVRIGVRVRVSGGDGDAGEIGGFRGLLERFARDWGGGGEEESVEIGVEREEIVGIVRRRETKSERENFVGCH